MSLQIKRFFLFLLILTSLPPMAAVAGQTAFQPGEKLTFQLRWEFVPAGEAVLTVEPMETIDGRQAYHFVMTAKSNSFLDWFYKVRDRIDSYTDTAMIQSLLYKKKQREGHTKRDVVVTFDWEKKTAQYTNGKKKKDPVTLLPGAFDPLGIFYFVRNSDLDNIDSIERPVSDGKKCVMGIGNIIRRETITVPAGTFDTFLLSPDLKDVGGVFEKSKDSNIHIWITADSRHIPVKIQSKVVVGRFMGELTDMSFPEP